MILRDKRVLILGFLILFFVSFCLPAQAKLPGKLTFKPLQFKPPKAEKVVLDNGMTLYLLEDHELPLFNISARIRTGYIYEPLEKIGLTGIFGSVMRTGGTKNRTPEEINEQLEYIGGSVETSIGREAGFASLSVLKQDIDKGLEIFADILMNPTFREDKIRIRKQQMIEEVRRRNDNPGSIVSREFNALIYGRTHPYGWRTEIETIENVTREDLIAWHQKYYHPNNLMMAISGDFKKDEIIAKIQKAFAGWQKSEVNFPTVPKVEERLVKSVNYIYKDINQSNIRIGHLGVKRHNPDRFALEVMNYLWGGGWTSKLFREVRSRKGLAYDVGSYFTEPGDLGVLAAYCQTKASSTYEAIATILNLMEEMRTKPVSEEDLKVAKDALINSFVFRFTSSAEIAAQQMDLDYYGYPPDYLETYCDKIARVTKEDVMRVAKKYLHPDKVCILVVGKSAEFDKPLSEFGPVNIIPLEESLP